MMGGLSDWCVYTRVDSGRLVAAEKSAATFERTESKSWVSVFRERPLETRAGCEVPVLLSAADGSNHVRWWGILTSARRRGRGTAYTLDRVRRLPRAIRPDQLVKQDDSRLSADFIRPYALCRTPPKLSLLRSQELSMRGQGAAHGKGAYEFLARSLEYAHRLAPESWVLTWSAGQLRLNVGQVAVVTLRADRVQVYVAARLASPFAGQVKLSRTRSVYSRRAIHERVQMVELEPSQLTRLPAGLVDAHRAVLEAAARVKTRSPWRAHLSEEWLGRIERVVGRSLPRPGDGPIAAGEFRGSYWLVKGRRDRNDFDALLAPGRKDRWRTAAPPSGWARGDRLFFWESSPHRRIVGLGQILAVPRRRVRRHGDVLVGVRYLTPRLPVPVPQDWLRAQRELRDASFLTFGRAGTFYPMTAAEAAVIHRMVLAANPELDDPWNLFTPNGYSDEPSPTGFGPRSEGDRRLVRHYRLERDRELVVAKKSAYRRQHGHLGCEVCGFDFNVVYGALGRDFCEVHHVKPLGQARGPRRTRLEDLAVVCANCHRAMHLECPPVGVARLRRILHERRRSRAAVSGLRARGRQAWKDDLAMIAKVAGAGVR